MVRVLLSELLHLAVERNFIIYLHVGVSNEDQVGCLAEVCNEQLVELRYLGSCWDKKRKKQTYRELSHDIYSRGSYHDKFAQVNKEKDIYDRNQTTLLKLLRLSPFFLALHTI